MKHLVLDRGNWLRIATWLEINEMIDWKTVYQSPFKQANKAPTCWVWSIFSGPADLPRTLARIKNWVMIKHEFMKNNFIPKTLFCSKRSRFNKKSCCLYLFAKYFIWICCKSCYLLCGMQEKVPTALLSQGKNLQTWIKVTFWDGGESDRCEGRYLGSTHWSKNWNLPEICFSANICWHESQPVGMNTVVY